MSRYLSPEGRSKSRAVSWSVPEGSSGGETPGRRSSASSSPSRETCTNKALPRSMKLAAAASISWFPAAIQAAAASANALA